MEGLGGGETQRVAVPKKITIDAKSEGKELKSIQCNSSDSFFGIRSSTVCSWGGGVTTAPRCKISRKKFSTIIIFERTQYQCKWSYVQRTELQCTKMEDAAIFNYHLIHLTAIWYYMWPFGIFYSHLVYFFTSWYVAPRKIWQPWC
jgi:hypothetical protein